MPVLLALVLAASQSPLVAAPGFSVTDVEPAKARFFNDYLVEQLRNHQVRVSAESEIAAVLGLERQAQLLGCGEQSSCLAELAGGLGVDAILVGNLTRLGPDYAMTLKVVSAKDGSVWVSASTRGKDAAALASWLADQSGPLADAINRRGGGSTFATAAPMSASSVSAASSSPETLIRFTLLGVEYDHRMGAGLFLGGRARLVPILTTYPGFGGGLGMVGTADVQFLARYELVERPGFGLGLSAGVGGAGYSTYLWSAHYQGLVVGAGLELRIFGILLGAEANWFPAGRYEGEFSVANAGVSLNVGYAWGF